MLCLFLLAFRNQVCKFLFGQIVVELSIAYQDDTIPPISYFKAELAKNLSLLLIKAGVANEELDGEDGHHPGFSEYVRRWFVHYTVPCIH